MEMYSTYNEEKSVVAESLLETWTIKFVNIRLQFQKTCILIN